MVDLIDECAETKTIAEQDEFILEFGTLLAGAGEKLDSLPPFGVSEMRFPGKRMKMRY